MGNKITEEEQRQLFIDNWKNKTVQLVCEVPVFCRSVDLVKYDKKRKTVTAVEFKTHNWKRAIEQVISTAVSFDYLEICIQKPKTKKTQNSILDMCKELGIGLYFFEIESQRFEYILQPQKVDKIWKVQKTQVIKFIEKGEDVLYGK